ncbi:RcpC/CpaB family pilus assembly protein [Desulfonema magnum]|uniref:Pilus assembly protein domain-containing protein n=1 Tax=Desulfonema magnum TaxID=45655 RepID=A0A975GMF2_9BACT|nr:RcpC/CpaB family pilus assembly protein [Desulfonema magnum]QTA86742.1 Pilus assembly protein domain-containing protein [Desulfonema magnum]
MRKFRGVIALLLSVCLGLLAAYSISVYLNPEHKEEIKQEKKSPEKKPPPPPSSSLSAEIPEGMRVVSIKVNEVSGVSDKLEKGDRVDVIAVSNLTDGGSGTYASG